MIFSEHEVVNIGGGVKCNDVLFQDAPLFVSQCTDESAGFGFDRIQ